MTSSHLYKKIWLLICVLYLLGCAQQASLTKSDLNPGLAGLTQVDWHPANIEAIQQCMQTYGKNSPKYDAKMPPLAMFDWDNTMILNDIGEALFFSLVDDMGFSFNEDFWALIPEKYRDTLKHNYQEIKDLSPAARNQSASYQAYRKTFVACYFAIDEEQGTQTAYQWLVHILAGLTSAQVKAASETALHRELHRPIGKETIAKSPEDSKPVTVNTGVRYYPQMAELVQKLKDAGFDIWIVSASAQWPVETLAKRVGIDADHVLGILPEIENNKIVPRIKRFTYREGKAIAIRQEIGRTPIFAAGDSNGDLEMLLLGSGPRLVIDRGKKPLMDTARERGWLVQKPFLVPAEKGKSSR
jgi:HAD superfamily phosphoserine phosphatase-like hydrolase